MEIINRPWLRAELLQLGPPGHVVLVLADDLAQHADRRAAGHPGEVDGRLGVPGPLQHAALAGLEREDVARAAAGRRACVAGSTSARIVAARSAAEMPVVVPWR